MPVPIAAKAGVIAVSVAVAAAIAVYESPELRRMAEDLRRRIAIALHSLGDGVDPTNRQPVFNRPEDAEGFFQSRRAAAGPEPGVDADEETRRKQREELLYWNAVLEEKTKEKGGLEPAATTPKLRPRGSTFDDFMQQDSTAERGTFVFNTGADSGSAGLAGSQLRRRDVEGVRGLKPSVYANPFADENGIDDLDDQPGTTTPHPLSPGKDEVMSDDIYNATEPASPQTLPLQPPPAAELLFDYNNDSQPPRNDATTPEPAPQPSERQLAPHEFVTAGQSDREDAYASIQAWARSSNPSFYSPIPVSPPAPLSEPEMVSDGAFTPTDSSSQAGSGVDIGNDVASSRGDGEHSRYYDVISEDGDGMPTPVSWTEVGSVVSESDGPVRA